ncbi:MAG: branched-chain amino acid ABC transporter permease [bacterium]
MFYVELLINGVLVGTLYALIALGFVLIYKATDAINFAQGEFVMFAGYVLAASLQLYGFPLVWALFFGFTAMILMGYLVERVVLQHLIGRPVVAVIMATIGLAAFLQGLAPFLWGPETKNVPLPIPQEPVFVGEILLSQIELYAALVALGSIGVFGLFFNKTRTGVALRAVADDQQVSLAMGINVKLYFAMAWAISGIVATVGGVVWGNLLGVDIQLALVGLKVFPVVILGGLDSIVGALVGGIIVGVVESLAAGFLDPLVGGGTKDFTPYVLMVLVLMFRPYGLFGKEIIERV